METDEQKEKPKDALDGCELDFSEEATSDDELDDLIEKEE